MVLALGGLIVFQQGSGAAVIPLVGVLAWGRNVCCCLEFTEVGLL